MNQYFVDLISQLGQALIPEQEFDIKHNIASLVDANEFGNVEEEAEKMEYDEKVSFGEVREPSYSRDEMDVDIIDVQMNADESYLGDIIDISDDAPNEVLFNQEAGEDLVDSTHNSLEPRMENQMEAHRDIHSPKLSGESEHSPSVVSPESIESYLFQDPIMNSSEQTNHISKEVQTSYDSEHQSQAEAVLEKVDGHESIEDGSGTSDSSKIDAQDVEQSLKLSSNTSKETELDVYETSANIDENAIDEQPQVNEDKEEIVGDFEDFELRAGQSDTLNLYGNLHLERIHVEEFEVDTSNENLYSQEKLEIQIINRDEESRIESVNCEEEFGAHTTTSEANSGSDNLNQETDSILHDFIQEADFSTENLDCVSYNQNQQAEVENEEEKREKEVMEHGDEKSLDEVSVNQGDKNGSVVPQKDDIEIIDLVGSDDDNDEEEAGKHEEEYAVEAIVEKKLVKGAPYYYVKWEGFSESQNTWEPVENLLACMDLVKQFEESLSQPRTSKSKRSERFQQQPHDTSDEKHSTSETSSLSENIIRVDTRAKKRSRKNSISDVHQSHQENLAGSLSGKDADESKSSHRTRSRSKVNEVTDNTSINEQPTTSLKRRRRNISSTSTSNHAKATEIVLPNTISPRQTRSRKRNVTPSPQVSQVPPRRSSSRTTKISSESSSSAAVEPQSARASRNTRRSTISSGDHSERAESTSPEQVFEVEEIVNHSIHLGKLSYLVKWKGYESEDDTWEPEENLIDGAQNVLLRYKKKTGLKS